MRLSKQIAVGALVVAWIGPALGCDKSSDKDDTASSTSAVGDSSSGTGDDGADGDSTESGGEVTCGRAVDLGGTARFHCSVPFECIDDGGVGTWACGPLTAFTEEGCLRARCVDDSNCESDQKCYRLFDFEPDACVTSSHNCFDKEDGSCTCVASGDCQLTSGWCVQADDYPS